ncbi:TlpA disulfide reductase family protein [Pedobacter frigidisoli]|uniref:TlpA family protein disulfide reductase n=1 Tax=Pedobacter frigidisoli TaxID=2530455 RepID=UPI00293176AE|nr:TlpA disulfide reductase family protein [Pedobacter frigidisoli]
MKLKITTLLFLGAATIILVSYFIPAQARVAVGDIKIRVFLKPAEKFSIFYDEDKTIGFRNLSNHDTILIKTMASSKAIEFRYGLIDHGVFYHHKFYLHPGDELSLQVKNQFDIEVKDGNSSRLFIDSWFNEQATKLPSSKGKEAQSAYFNAIKSIYRKQLKRIDSLSGTGFLNQATAHTWKLAKTTAYYTALLKAITPQNFQNVPAETKLKAHQILKEINTLSQIQSPDVDALIYYITSYHLTRDQRDLKNIDQRLKFLISNEQFFGAERVLSSAIASLKHYSRKSDPAYQAAYKRASAYNQLKGSSHSEVLNHLSQYQFRALNSVRLIDPVQKTQSLENVIDEKDSLVFIDMWASWCVPCRKQTPFLEAVKTRLRDKPIKFISISIDEESKSGEWIAALKDDKLYGDLYQYRLLDKPHSPLMSFFDIQSIPRYLVIKRNGTVLNDHFVSPDDPAFEKRLLELLKSW